MLNNIFLSFALFKLKGRFRGAAMTEYAVLLAFVAVVGAVFVFDWTDFVDNGNIRFEGTTLATSIYSAVLNAWSAIVKVGTN